MKRYFTILIVLSLFVLSSCDKISEEQNNSEKNSSSIVDKAENQNNNEESSRDFPEASLWLEDLEQLKHDITWYNSAPFERFGEDAFNKLYDDIYGEIPNLSNAQREYRFRELIYSLGDGHVDMWTDGEHEASLPVMIDRLSRGANKKDGEDEYGYFIINATEKNKSLIGLEVKEINGISIDELIEKFEKISNFENEHWRLAGAIDKMHHTYFYKLIDAENENPMVITVNDIELRCVPLMSFYGSLEWAREIKIGEMPNRLISYFYTYETPYQDIWLDDDKVCVIQFSTCYGEYDDYPIYEFGKDVKEKIIEKRPKSLMIDLRDNGGGSPSALYGAFSEQFFRDTGFYDSPNFYVAINRNTFSAGVTTAHLLKSKFGATLIGTPTGGSPFTTNVSDSANKVLKNTGINFRISSDKVGQEMIETPSELPDVEIEIDIDSLKNNIDSFWFFVTRDL